MSIVSRINWSQLDRIVNVHQRNRETHAPVVSLFRWWARRPHAVAGAILDAAQDHFGRDSFVVADPFSGGGTVAFEAVRRDLLIYAQDLHLWPSRGLATALYPSATENFVQAKAQLLNRLESHRKKYWYHKDGVDWEITHIIRVRSATCRYCDSKIYLFREPFISLASRRAEQKYGFFGCPGCGTTSYRASDVKSFKCDSCGLRHSISKMKEQNLRLQMQCPHCIEDNDINFLTSHDLKWKAILIQEHQLDNSKSHVVLREVRRKDPVKDDPRVENEGLLGEGILPGLETNHLIRQGFKCWRDLYTHRQLNTIFAALEQINKLDTTSELKDRLQLSIMGACEMPGFLCRWERYHPKALEALANHRYARTTIAVETNLLSPIGRGTIPRRLDGAQKALAWMIDQGMPRRTVYSSSEMRKRDLVSGALVVTGSSERQLLRNGSVKLVLTDPPYHDDLQYGELARLFHVWMKDTLGIVAKNEESEAVPNALRGTGSDHYEDIVAACLAESKRTLAKDGRLVLTFHNKNILAWTALANALRRAGFLIVSLATVSAENAADHSKRGKKAFLSDLVIECMAHSKRRKTTRLAIHGKKKSPERRNLLAMGKAVARKVNSNSSTALKVLYVKYLKGKPRVKQLIH